MVTCERVGGEGEAVLANQVARVVRSMCSGSEAGLYLRLIDFVYHSTLGVRVIKKEEGRARLAVAARRSGTRCFR